MKLNIKSKISLNNGVKIPIVGIGTFKMRPGEETQNAISHALKVGYRHIDTATIYKNEADVGIVVKKSGINREEIFITTKLWNDNHGYENTIKAFEKSLKIMGLSYVDLYLIHWPLKKLETETWKAMEKLYEENKCRAIGVSNYAIRHLKIILEQSNIIPMINQVEFNPYIYQKELFDFCQKRKIVLEAYSPLTKGKKLEDPRLNKIALNYSKSPAQVLIRWAIQRDVVVLPKSSKNERITENADVFNFIIEKRDMEEIDSYNQNLVTGWYPLDW